MWDELISRRQSTPGPGDEPLGLQSTFMVGQHRTHPMSDNVGYVFHCSRYVRSVPAGSLILPFHSVKRNLIEIKYILI